MIALLLTIFLIELYLFAYYRPKLDKTSSGDILMWYTKRKEISPGKFIKERRYFYIKQFRL